jgi:hypothetical protein
MYDFTGKNSKDLLRKDENGRYIDLVIPYVNDEFPEVILTGKCNLDFTLDEIVRFKAYIGMLKMDERKREMGQQGDVE